MNNLKNWIKNFRKNKKIMHRILVGGIVAVCLVGMAAAGYLMENVPGVFDAAQTESIENAEENDGGKARQAGSLEEETEAGAASGAGTEVTAGGNGTRSVSDADTSSENGLGETSDSNQGSNDAQSTGASQGQAGEANVSGQNGSDSQSSSGDQAESQNPSDSEGQSQGTQELAEISCTISIRCDSISGNGILTANGHPELESYAANPVILGNTAVKVKKGANVYEVLLQACQSAGIHLESSYTPAYGSYYVQGINHLYEWQAGPGSGWIFTVNGQSVSVGASSYQLSEGDVIVWEYVRR